MRFGLFALAVLGSACVTPLSQLTEGRTIPLAQTKAEVRWSTDDATQIEVLESALNAAGVALRRWSPLKRSVTVYVLRSHEDLEAAIRRRNYGWLKAWATDEAVLLQSPRTWRTGGASELDVTEALTHELTHVLLFQACGEGQTWARQGIPFWFREGMATVTANQGYRYSGLEDAALWLENHRELNPFDEGDEVATEFSGAVYGLSHHAMMFLLRRYTDQAVLKTLEQLSFGANFKQAFQIATGLSPSGFIHEFENYLLMRGFRGWGLPIRRNRPPPELVPRDERPALPDSTR